MAFTNSELISLGSFCISLIAAAIAGRSLRNSTKALRLAESESSEKKLGIDVYLIESRKIVLANDESFAAFAVSYTNVASIPNSLRKVELMITYVDHTSEARQILLQPQEVLPAAIGDINCLQVPINIPARNATTGWLVFKLPEILRTRAVKAYELAAYNTQGSKVSVVSYLLMEAVYRAHKASQ